MLALDTEGLVSWLREAANLKEADCGVLMEEEYEGDNVPGFTFEQLKRDGLKSGPAGRIMRVIEAGRWP